jgi:hypothetical protein
MFFKNKRPYNRSRNTEDDPQYPSLEQLTPETGNLPEGIDKLEASGVKKEDLTHPLDSEPPHRVPKKAA